MHIQVETAKVYRGGNRRYLTKRAAYYAEARKRWRIKYNGADKCMCEPDVGYTCAWCVEHGYDYKYDVIARYARMLMYHDRIAEEDE